MMISRYVLSTLKGIIKMTQKRCLAMNEEVQVPRRTRLHSRLHVVRLVLQGY